jgi:hypothetical protein
MCGGVLFFIFGLLPLAFIIAFCGLEIAISFYSGSGVRGFNKFIY